MSPDILLFISDQHAPQYQAGCLLYPSPPKARPCILYLHGGWQYGSRKVVLPFCRYLAEQANAVVAVPEYHLAPEHRWPAALEDCWQLL